MLFVTICTLISGFSMRNSMNENLKTLCPADIELTTQSNGKAVDTIKYLNDYDSSFMDYISEYVQFDRYKLAEVAINDCNFCF